jgi:hypothetical protein
MRMNDLVARGGELAIASAVLACGARAVVAAAVDLDDQVVPGEVDLDPLDVDVDARLRAIAEALEEAVLGLALRAGAAARCIWSAASRFRDVSRSMCRFRCANGSKCANRAEQ